MSVTEITNEILDILKEISDEDYKNFHSKLLPKDENVLGISVPKLRNLSKNVLLNYKNDIVEYVFSDNEQYYEEYMLKALILCGLKVSDEEKLNYLSKFLHKIHNWAVCDILCSSLKIKNKSYLWNFIQPYLNSKYEYEVRFAIVTLLNYTEDKYINDILLIVSNIKHNSYYVKMAVAWLISIAFIKCRNVTFEFLQNNQLDDFTYNKALQKIIESFRVTKEDKLIIKSMKRKKK